MTMKNMASAGFVLMNFNCRVTFSINRTPLIEFHRNIFKGNIHQFFKVPIRKQNSSSPGQEFSLQACVSSTFPLHSLPPCSGVGLVQVLERFWVPPPHSLLQVLQSPYSLHPPCTKMWKWWCNHLECVSNHQITWTYSYRFVRDFAWDLAGRAGKVDRAIDTRAQSLYSSISAVQPCLYHLNLIPLIEILFSREVPRRVLLCQPGTGTEFTWLARDVRVTHARPLNS